MAKADYLADCEDKNDSTTVLASAGVEFLLSSQGKVPISSTEGRTICLFFSAYWCRPCKSFTPHLVQLYNTLRKNDHNIEIIFISFDRDEKSFTEFFNIMPWLAVPYDISLQKRLSRRFNVHHLPSLIPLTLNGNAEEENAVDMIEEYGMDAFPFTRRRRAELIALDEAKRTGGKLEELLAHEGRDYLVSKEGAEVSVSSLTGKTIGLYFGAYWCPPARTFTTQLIEAYNELVTSQSQPFEVIFISTDRDLDEFDRSLSSMPWLAIPYEDRTRNELRRVFEIKGIPALILIGPEGKTISKNGRSLISEYGALSYPFTESRIVSIKDSLRKQGENLPQRVQDLKHEHELELDMAKAYVCDACKKQGRFWAFSCAVCDYDLHPSCVERNF